ncbi:MAG: hypothetical protein K8T20_00510 [Planctomycetes bacterium]|nr:hypothetical protein [Planctomycetota bacterium]
MRLPGVRDGKGPLIVRLAYWRLRSIWGQVLEPTRIYALVPRLMMAFGKLLRAVEKPHKLPLEMKSIAMARVAMRVGCPF